MPQASPELRRMMQIKFGSLDSEPVEHFLFEKGWKLGSNYALEAPYRSLGAIPREEFDCALFLVHEWDYTVKSTIPEDKNG